MIEDAGAERVPEEIKDEVGAAEIGTIAEAVSGDGTISDQEAPHSESRDELLNEEAALVRESAAVSGLPDEVSAVQEIPYYTPAYANHAPVYAEPPITRTPNFLDAVIFLLIMTASVVVTAVPTALAIYLHWFGIKGSDDAAKNTGMQLAVQLTMYLLSLAIAVPVFRRLWGKRYFDGLHWHVATALRRWYWLIPAAVGCNVMAALGDKILPFPEQAPIDLLFKTSRDAWMMAVFGVTIAPFFEEMIFRGFLLPATSTAWDWCSERITGAKPRPPDAEGNPVWSVGAMVIGSLVVSAPFALMHSPQLGHAWGPLVLLYCVSLALCATRLVTRSLAASTLVHSAYNLMLFAVMFAQTDGFRHMDKM